MLQTAPARMGTSPFPMDEDTIAMLNAPNNALIGQFIRQHPMGPIIWEQ